MEYERKVDLAIKLLKAIPQDGPIELCYSGGKDSDVILQLAKMAEIPFDAIYKNTTIDPPGTLQHCRENGVRIVQPKQSFFKIIEERSVPSRFSRFCCQVLKEYKIHDRAIQGIRRSESTARTMRYKEPEYCRTYSKTEKVRIYLPILEWTNDDVARFIAEHNIKCAPIYYDMGGGLSRRAKTGLYRVPDGHRQWPFRFSEISPAAADGYQIGSEILRFPPDITCIRGIWRGCLQSGLQASFLQDYGGIYRPRHRWHISGNGYQSASGN